MNKKNGTVLRNVLFQSCSVLLANGAYFSLRLVFIRRLENERHSFWFKGYFHEACEWHSVGSKLMETSFWFFEPINAGTALSLVSFSIYTWSFLPLLISIPSKNALYLVFCARTSKQHTYFFLLSSKKWCYIY